MPSLPRPDPRFLKARRSLEEAVALQQQGLLAESEKLYARVVKLAPDYFDALHFYGMLKFQQKQFDDALKLVAKATKVNPRSANALNSLGMILGSLRRHSEALASFDSALRLDPNHVPALSNRGYPLNELKRYQETIDGSDRVLAIDPNHLDAYITRGAALLMLERYEEALECYEMPIKRNPGFAMAWVGRGNALVSLKRYDEARATFRHALALDPNLFEALTALTALLILEGNAADGLNFAVRALAVKETPETKWFVVTCLCAPPQAHPGMGDLRDLLLRAISELWGDPRELAGVSDRFLPLNSAIRDSAARVLNAWPARLPIAELTGAPSNLMAIAEDKLLRTLLETIAVGSVWLERFATALRSTLLAAAVATPGSPVPDSVLTLYCSIARQCFINDYAFAYTDAEIEQARTLREALAAAMASGAPIPSILLVAVAAYFPLHALKDSQQLLRRSWPNAVNALLAQQVRAPLEEQRLRVSMPALTAIDNAVSLQVRDQYEEHPYPLWIKMAAPLPALPIDEYMRRTFPQSPLIELGKDSSLDVLIAGCGTGQHSIDSARRYKGAQVLAVDLSLASLCYAQRQTQELGLNTIRYAQADIMKLSSIGQTFDLIESMGVLHHLADPFSGWRLLLSMLRPNGFMRLGFYSEIGRRPLLPIQQLIQERGYQRTADDIRRFRQELLDQADGKLATSVMAFVDFFSLSECRDLLFHVQEHRLTLPRIAEFLAENDLQFIGFEARPGVTAGYRRRFPSDPAMTDLAQWHQYETENPDTFRAMYQFFVQKK